MTPAKAIRAGADHLVVGRPIVAAPDPKAADGSAKSTSADAVIAISIVSSDASVTVANGTLTAGDAANLHATNTVNVTTTADGSAGGNAGTAAGGVLGFSFFGRGQNAALAFVKLKDWNERKAPGNSVQSAQIANVRIENRGRGQLEDAQAMGWMARFFLNILPI